MEQLIFVAAIGKFVIVPCWKAVISALLLESDPEKWEKWQEKENERRKRRDALIAKGVNGFLWVMGWVERKLRKPPKPDPPPLSTPEGNDVRPPV